MKFFKPLVAFILFIVVSNVSAQIVQPSRSKFNYIDILNYTTNCRQEILWKVEKSIWADKLKMYKDSGLRERLNSGDFFELFEVKRHVQIPNPQNPDDLFDIIDTVLFDLVYPNELTFLQNGAFEFSANGQAKMYVSKKHLYALLDDNLVSMLDYFQHLGINDFSNISLLNFSKQQIEKLGETLYDYGVTGKIKAYRNELLEEVYSLEEIIDRITWKENFVYQNPKNPNDKFDTIDSVLSHPFNPDSINFVRVYFKWENDGFKSTADFLAISPLFNIIAAGIVFPNQPMFLLKANDYIKTLNKQEKGFWLHFYTFLLQNVSSNGLYDYYDENNLPDK